MFGLKKTKTASSLISKFTQQFKDIVEEQEKESSKAQEAIDLAMAKKQAAMDEIALASKAVEKIEGMFNCSK